MSMTTKQVLKMPQDAERAARLATSCPGCGQPKEIGLVVCWPCFKYREDGFKWAADCDLEKWLQKVGRPSLAAQGIC